MERGGSSLEMPEGEREAERVLPASLAADSSRKSSWGLLFPGIVGGALVAVYAVATPFVMPALRRICLPFVPATSKQIENVVKMLRRGKGPLVDIGSGDGRIVIAAAKEGFEAVGYELNPWLVWYSRYRAWREGVQGSARFYVSDLWKVTFSQYSNVIIFGVPQMRNLESLRITDPGLQKGEYKHLDHFVEPKHKEVLSVLIGACPEDGEMPQLEKKLELELEDDARVIACRFPFPHWTPDHITGEGIDTVWAYDMYTFRGREKRPWKMEASR